MSKLAIAAATLSLATTAAVSFSEIDGYQVVKNTPASAYTQAAYPLASFIATLEDNIDHENPTVADTANHALALASFGQFEAAHDLWQSVSA